MEIQIGLGTCLRPQGDGVTKLQMLQIDLPRSIAHPPTCRKVDGLPLKLVCLFCLGLS